MGLPTPEPPGLLYHRTLKILIHFACVFNISQTSLIPTTLRKVSEMTEDFLEARPFELVLENGLHFN